MTLKDFRERLINICNSSEQYEDWEIVIPNNKSSMGPKSVTKVQGIDIGFDHNRGKIFIHPEVKMTELAKNQPKGENIRN